MTAGGNGRAQQDVWHCRWNGDHKVTSLNDLYSHEAICPD